MLFSNEWCVAFADAVLLRSLELGERALTTRKSMP